MQGVATIDGQAALSHAACESAALALAADPNLPQALNLQGLVLASAGAERRLMDISAPAASTASSRSRTGCASARWRAWPTLPTMPRCGATGRRWPRRSRLAPRRRCATSRRVGGNLLQRTRCGYFRSPDLPCNKRQPGSGCAARDGENRLHAIFGASPHCAATHASDLAVALLALEARVQVRRHGAERVLPIAELFRLPGDTPERDSACPATRSVPTHRAGMPPQDFGAQARSWFWMRGPAAVGLESTILKVEGDTIRLLRPGGLDAAEVALRRAADAATTRRAPFAAAGGAPARRSAKPLADRTQRTQLPVPDDAAGRGVGRSPHEAACVARPGLNSLAVTPSAARGL